MQDEREIHPFIRPTHRRDVLSDLSNAPLLTLEIAIKRLVVSGIEQSGRVKKDGKDGTADGVVGSLSGPFAEDDTGKESSDDTGKESSDDTGKESSDDTGKESSDDTGKEASDDTGKEASDDTGKESSDDTGKESSDDTGKEASDDTGKEASDDTGKEASDDTGKEASDDTGKEASDDTGKEASDDTGKEASDDTGKEASEGTGKEASDDTGKETAEATGKETIDDIIHWYTGTFSAKENKEVLDDNPRNTALEAATDFDSSTFAGNVNEVTVQRSGLSATLDIDRMNTIGRKHNALLDDLIRPDRPLI